MSWRKLILIGWVVSGLAGAQAQVYEGRTLVEASLVADTTAVVPGKPFRVGLVLKMAPHWHTYWQYSGDAGIPTKIEWTLPEGFGAGPIDWPLPEGILEAGDIQVYAYGDEVMLISTIQPAARVAEESVTLAGAASWLVCEEICIPGGADVSLELPVAAAAEAANAELFDRWAARLPSGEVPPFPVEWSRDGDDLVARIQPGEGVDEVDFFPLPAPEQTAGHAEISGAGDGFDIRIAAEGELRGVLVVDGVDGRRGWLVVADGVADGGQTASPTGGHSLWQALLFGMLGGLILNLMPCVLPVISLKIFGFIQQAGEEPRKILAHGLAFSAGIFAWFLGLGIVIAVIRSGGGEVTWAFQFQNPIFNLVISAIVFVFALNLMGVFEVTLPGAATGAMGGLAGREGLGGSFFQGVFATLLATPCTGPFLGSALGFAFSQSPPVILAMFAAVAFGMALPYLALSARPGWMKFLPKPGAWMERLKQFMAFPLLATLLWLLFIIGQQMGVGSVIWVGAFLLCLALACWIYGAFCGPTSRGKSRVIALGCVVIVAVAGGWLTLSTAFAGADDPSTRGTAVAKGGIPWQPYSAALVDSLIAEEKTVFIDFTADWCLTCKFNERTAIDRPAVIAEIERLGIVPVKADWTNANPEITAALDEFGRVGVPFYVIYPAGDAGNPITLPEFLTEGIVLDALAKLGKPE